MSNAEFDSSFPEYSDTRNILFFGSVIDIEEIVSPDPTDNGKSPLGMFIHIAGVDILLQSQGAPIFIRTYYSLPLPITDNMSGIKVGTKVKIFRSFGHLGGCTETINDDSDHIFFVLDKK